MNPTWHDHDRALGLTGILHRAWPAALDSSLLFYAQHMRRHLDAVPIDTLARATRAFAAKRGEFKLALIDAFILTQIDIDLARGRRKRRR